MKRCRSSRRPNGMDGRDGGGKSMRIAGYMGVSENSGTPKSSILIGYKPSNLGYHYFWKHLYLEFLLGKCESISQSRYVICRFFWDPDPASSDLFKRSGISDKLVRWMVPLWSPLWRTICWSWWERPWKPWERKPLTPNPGGIGGFGCCQE